MTHALPSRGKSWVNLGMRSEEAHDLPYHDRPRTLRRSTKISCESPARIGTKLGATWNDMSQESILREQWIQ